MIWFGGKILDPATIEQVVWTLLHFLWQGLALAAIFAVVNFWLRRGSANARYVAGCVTLTLMAAAPLVTFCMLQGRFDDPGPLNLTPPSLVGHPFSSRADAVRWITHVIEPRMPTLLKAWVVGTVLLALRQFGTWVWLQNALRRHAKPLRPEWIRLIDVARRMKVSGVRFVETILVTGPATAGWLRPIVLLPAAALLGVRPDQLEALVAHELAHIRRHDYLVNGLQSVLETALFYHPAVWWVSHRVREERENCCDDLAARVVGDPLDYAEALTALEAARHVLPPFALGAAGHGKLWQRVARLLGEPSLQLRERTGRPALGAVLASCLVICGTCGYLFSQAISIGSERTIDSVRPLSGLVYEIARFEDEEGISDADFLVALDNAVASLGGGAADVDANLDALVDALGAAHPQALDRVILERVTVGDPYGYQGAADWTHGTHEQRLQLAQRLSAEAERLALDQSPRARRYARAALLLAAQDTFLFGSSQIARVVRQGWFELGSGLTDGELTRLERHLHDHLAITRVSIALRLQVEHQIEVLRDSPSQPDVVDAATHTLAMTASLAAVRPDVQWQVAMLHHRLLHVTDGAGQQSLAAAKPQLIQSSRSNTMARWLIQAETDATAKPTPAVRVISTEEAIRMRRPAR